MLRPEQIADGSKRLLAGSMKSLFPAHVIPIISGTNLSDLYVTYQELHNVFARTITKPDRESHFYEEGIFIGSELSRFISRFGARLKPETSVSAGIPQVCSVVGLDRVGIPHEFGFRNVNDGGEVIVRVSQLETIPSTGGYLEQFDGFLLREYEEHCEWYHQY